MEPTDSIASSVGPTIRRHRSKQDHATPWEFIRAVEDRFDKLNWDLAANKENTKAPNFITQAENSLTYDWNKLDGLLWLNPPFNLIEPWAAKCRWCSVKPGSRIIFLTPASVGSMWFAMHVHRHAYVLSLTPRLVFEGSEDPYPKDCMLSVFWGGLNGFDVWKWK